MAEGEKLRTDSRHRCLHSGGVRRRSPLINCLQRKNRFSRSRSVQYLTSPARGRYSYALKRLIRKLENGYTIKINPMHHWKCFSKQSIHDRETANKSAAHDYFNRLQLQQKLIPIETTILLFSPERAFLEEAVSLFEVNPCRWDDLTNQIDMFYRPGKASREQPRRLKRIDAGVLALTDKRVIFDGPVEYRGLEFKDIISVKAWAEVLEVKSWRTPKNEFYRVENPIIWAQMIDGMASGRLKGFIER